MIEPYMFRNTPIACTGQTVTAVELRFAHVTFEKVCADDLWVSGTTTVGRRIIGEIF